jgi:hypothetical protein
MGYKVILEIAPCEDADEGTWGKTIRSSHTLDIGLNGESGFVETIGLIWCVSMAQTAHREVSLENFNQAKQAMFDLITFEIDSGNVNLGDFEQIKQSYNGKTSKCNFHCHLIGSVTQKEKGDDYEKHMFTHSGYACDIIHLTEGAGDISLTLKPDRCRWTSFDPEIQQVTWHRDGRSGKKCMPINPGN